MAPLQPDELFACLDRHGVRYVLIGGLAAVLHGSPLQTVDMDICPSRTPDNLARLAAALDDMDARIRTSDAPDGIRFPRDAVFLSRVDLLNLVTRFGDVDLSFTPSGTTGFDDLSRRADEYSWSGDPSGLARGRHPFERGGQPPEGSTQLARSASTSERDPQAPWLTPLFLPARQQQSRAEVSADEGQGTQKVDLRSQIQIVREIADIDA